ncbi:MAG: hypothetical protein AB1465_07105 [Patescibacteria group bacterium]
MPKKVIYTHHPDITRPPEGEEEEHHIMTPEEIKMEWYAPEYQQYERHPAWFLFLGIIAGILTIYALIVGNFLFAIIIVMLAIIINMLSRRQPENLHLAITRHGFKVNDKLYTFEDDLASFWILYRPPHLKTLNLQRKQNILPTLTFQLSDENPLKIRELLLDHLPEDIEKEEHYADKIARQMKF